MSFYNDLHVRRLRQLLSSAHRERERGWKFSETARATLVTVGLLLKKTQRLVELTMAVRRDPLRPWCQVYL